MSRGRCRLWKGETPPSDNEAFEAGILDNLLRTSKVRLEAGTWAVALTSGFGKADELTLEGYVSASDWSELKPRVSDLPAPQWEDA